MDNKVPFPHILETGSVRNGFSTRLVTDEDVKVGGKITEYVGKTVDAQNNVFKLYNTWTVEEVWEKRQAKGDWSGWPTHPFYYAARLKNSGQKSVKV